MTKRNSKVYILWQKIIKILGIIALIGTFFLAFWLYRLGILNDSNALKDLVQRYRLWGPFVFIVVQIIQIVFPVIPGGLTTVAGFLIFGPVTGFIYNYVGIIIGSIVLFLLVKTYGRKFILLFVNDKTFYKYERRLETPGYEKLFIFCMASPVSPADIMVMITGLTDMSLKRFVTILLITKPISIIGYSYLFIFGKDVISWFLQH
ncbi:TPA: TVP38/TMEM64 family protein [Streptococcus pyogenes]|uniref:TVP38/TMEM64 family protein n=1 Tax=Streptococcus pyogenes TaxID=1314 RepID=UPI0010A11BCD|nr:TVP38/TMEM64 family protein [Streptococcus pyogenes]VHE53436.1 membrane-associated alkaline phosphatase [Streptococcus pyogenes]VHF12836.1 membrane-associated alkaline phosphatase [Streptococcus pyogenes]HEP1492509.1 TVP38/TMEM64 family protein [Streptococcus pyogenes]HEP2113022.1 TVP38/TMEM64 family protein [Streptococcus pyogenes]HEP2146483.1 TVP38/TMEM64 family protein [Streptococcus pyogenes]